MCQVLKNVLSVTFWNTKPESFALLHRYNMDAGGGSSDRERGWFDSGANGAKLGPSAMAGGAPGDPAQSGAETFSTRLCNSLPSPHDERVLLQNKAQGKNPLNKSHTVRCLIKCIQIIVGLLCASLCASGSLCHA